MPDEMVFVTSDGTGAELKPWGRVLVTVIGPDGKPVGPNSLDLDWSSDSKGMQCGGGDVGYGVNPDDKPVELPCQEGAWTIQVLGFPVPDQATVVYATGRVAVRGNVTTKITLRLKEAPPG